MRSSKPSWRESLFGWLGVMAPIRRAPGERMEQIREYMVQALMSGASGGASALAQRILNARDVEVLWYCRTDFMLTLCALHGEQQARVTVAEVTRMFEGLMPADMVHSSSRLAALHR